MNMEQYIALLGMGVAFGFIGSLFMGFVSWAISTVCRLVVKVAGEGVK